MLSPLVGILRNFHESTTSVAGCMSAVRCWQDAAAAAARAHHVINKRERYRMTGGNVENGQICGTVLSHTKKVWKYCDKVLKTL